MKKTYLAPQLSRHGNVEEITAVFGGPAQQDVLRNGNIIVTTGNQSINACAEQSGNCLP